VKQFENWTRNRMVNTHSKPDKNLSEKWPCHFRTVWFTSLPLCSEDPKMGHSITRTIQLPKRMMVRNWMANSEAAILFQTIFLSGFAFWLPVRKLSYGLNTGLKIQQFRASFAGDNSISIISSLLKFTKLCIVNCDRRLK
jgi:hypothetical protein